MGSLNTFMVMGRVARPAEPVGSRNGQQVVTFGVSTGAGGRPPLTLEAAGAQAEQALRLRVGQGVLARGLLRQDDGPGRGVLVAQVQALDVVVEGLRPVRAPRAEGREGGPRGPRAEGQPAEGAPAPADGSAPPADGSAPPADGSAPPADGAAAPAEGDGAHAEEGEDGAGPAEGVGAEGDAGPRRRPRRRRRPRHPGDREPRPGGPGPAGQASRPPGARQGDGSRAPDAAPPPPPPRPALPPPAPIAVPDPVRPPHDPTYRSDMPF